MLPDSGLQLELPRRRIHVLILRLGFGTALLIILAVSATSFALFGCSCDRTAQIEPQPIPPSSDPEPPAKLGPPSVPVPIH